MDIDDGALTANLTIRLQASRQAYGVGAASSPTAKPILFSRGVVSAKHSAAGVGASRPISARAFSCPGSVSKQLGDCRRLVCSSGVPA